VDGGPGRRRLAAQAREAEQHHQEDGPEEDHVRHHEHERSFGGAGHDADEEQREVQHRVLRRHQALDRPRAGDENDGQRHRFPGQTANERPE
jgi:hypothetical protein